MKIWKLSVTWENTVLWQNLNFVKENYFPNGFNGKPLEKWGEIEIKLKNKKVRDSIDAGVGKPVFSEKAVIVLMEFLKDNAQILPLKHENLKYYAINITNVVDAIDHEASDLEKLPNGKTIEIKNYKFKKEKILNQDIFKTPELPTLFVYVSDRFRQAVIDSKLKGFDFLELWDSEASIDNDLLEPIEWQDPINSNPMKFVDAMKHAEKTGQIFRSGKWRLKFNQKRELLIGEVDKRVRCSLLNHKT